MLVVHSKQILKGRITQKGRLGKTITRKGGWYLLIIIEKNFSKLNIPKLSFN